MLKQLTATLMLHKIKTFRVINSSAEKLSLEDESVDSVFAFNSIHHFNLPEFLREGSRVLKKGGWMFLYTRLRSQNSRNIWGRYFPQFNQKETRLYELDELEAAFRQTPGLNIQSIEYFKYKRISHLDRLLEQVKGHHYSTFYLYSKRELDQAFSEFKQNLRKNSSRDGKDGKPIRWVDENTLVIIRKERGPVNHRRTSQSG